MSGTIGIFRLTITFQSLVFIMTEPRTEKSVDLNAHLRGQESRSIKLTKEAALPLVIAFLWEKSGSGRSAFGPAFLCSQVPHI